MADHQSSKDRIKQITDGIEQGIKKLFESDRYRSYLSTMSRFHRYSVNNTLLIHSQRPDATLVAGFSRWKNQFGRHVKKGEKGIQILAPTPFLKKTEDIKIDPDTQLPVTDENGDVIMEEKTVKIPMFKVVSVFDVSQTEGKPLPSLAANLTGSVEQYALVLEALRRTSAVPILFKPLRENLDGYFNLDSQDITIREGMSQTQTISAIVHEMAHAHLHNRKDSGKDRNTEEVEAESISYAVCQYLGIETGENSFGYIASWSDGKELKELRSSLETIRQTSSELISGIEHHYKEICKERGIEEKAADTQETTQQEKPDAARQPDPYVSPEALASFGYTAPDMLPISTDFALELMDRNVPVFTLYADNTEEMAFDTLDITMHTGMLGVTAEDWQIARKNPDILALREKFALSYQQEASEKQKQPTKEERQSVLAKLKSYPPQPRKNASHTKHKEQER